MPPFCPKIDCLTSVAQPTLGLGLFEAIAQIRELGTARELGTVRELETVPLPEKYRSHCKQASH